MVERVAELAAAELSFAELMVANFDVDRDMDPCPVIPEEVVTASVEIGELWPISVTVVGIGAESTLLLDNDNLLLVELAPEIYDVSEISEVTIVLT